MATANLGRVNVSRCAPGELMGHDDAMVRAFAGAASRAWRTDGAVAMVSVDAEERIPILLGVGVDAAVATVIAYAAGGGDVPGEVIVPRGAMALLPSWVRPVEVVDWVWRSLDTPPPPQPAEDRVEWLDDEDAGAVKALLTEAAPGSSVWPGAPAARRWAGIRDAHRLRACLADTSRDPDIGHVSGITTAPESRGLGYGGAITAWAARRLFADGKRLVTLAAYAANAPAARVYDRLGFTDHHRMSSGQAPGS